MRDGEFRMDTATMLRFSKFIDSSDADGCWTWTGWRNHKGYGYFSILPPGAKHALAVGAHRYAWQMANGRPVPDGLCVMHTCDNRACVRASHLRVGTFKDNTQDMKRKGRDVPPPLHQGTSQWLAKLTPEAVRAIRQRRQHGATLRGLAKEFGVSKGTITNILEGKTWKHVA